MTVLSVRGLSCVNRRVSNARYASGALEKLPGKTAGYGMTDVSVPNA